MSVDRGSGRAITAGRYGQGVHYPGEVGDNSLTRVHNYGGGVIATGQVSTPVGEVIAICRYCFKAYTGVSIDGVGSRIGRRGSPIYLDGATAS